jgi:ribosomal protein L31
VNFIDPTGMVIDSLSQKQWDNEKNRITKQRDKLENKNKNGRNNERIASLNNTLNVMGTAEQSIQVYSLSKANGNMGGVTLDTKTKAINISYTGTANFVHELGHVEQFESRWGHIGFDANSGQVLGQDIYDEVQAYRAQYAYDPSSVTGLPSISTISSMQSILPAWVQGIKQPDGSLPYAPGGWANTGIAPVYINSTKADLIRAYPHINPRALPNTLKSYPGIYFRHR